MKTTTVEPGAFLAARLEKLKRQNRWMKCALICAVFLIAIFCGAFVWYMREVARFRDATAQDAEDAVRFAEWAKENEAATQRWCKEARELQDEVEQLRQQFRDLQKGDRATDGGASLDL